MQWRGPHRVKFERAAAFFVARCECRWTSAAVPTVEQAAEAYGNHRAVVARAHRDRELELAGRNDGE